MYTSDIMTILLLFRHSTSAGQPTLQNSDILTGPFQEFPKWCFHG